MIEKVTISGISLSYTLSSPHTGTCLLFLHGLQSRKEVFSKLQESLKKSIPFPQLAIDFIGFGDSDKPNDFSYSLGDQEKAIKGILNTLNITKAHIIGHSFGGMVGTLMMNTSPNMVESLISLEGNLSVEDCGESSRVARLSFDDFRENYYPTFKEKLVALREPNAPFRKEAVSVIPDYVFYKTSQTIVEWSKSNNLADIFEKASQPKLMICGEESSFHSRENSMVEIPKGGHFMFLDNPEPTVTAIHNFLNPLVAGL